MPTAHQPTAQQPTDSDLIIDARWVLPGTADAVTLEHASVAIAGGRIQALGASPGIHRSYRAASQLVLDRHVLLPGLVNAHGHAAMTLLRGFVEDAPLEAWLNRHIWPLEARLVDEDFVRAGVELAMAEMIRSGTTCFSDMYFFPEVSADAARRAGMRCQVAFPIIDFANAWSADVDDALHKGMALHDSYRGNPAIQVAFGPHSAYSVGRADLERIRTYADELDAPVHIHLHETAGEVAQAIAQHGSSWIEQLGAIGLLGPRTQAVHVTQATDVEVGRLAEAGVSVIHCPHSNLKLASGISPIRRLLDAGVNVALGTDGAASNNALDVFAEGRLASLLAKVSSGDAASLPEHRILELATLGGARALGIDQHTGSLEPGKLADVIAVDLSAPRFAPVYDPLSALIHCGGGSAVSHVWVAGRPLLFDGALQTLDETAIMDRTAAWAARVRG